MISSSSEIYVFVVYMETVFKNLHFETHFQNFSFSGTQKSRCCINEWPKRLNVV